MNQHQKIIAEALTRFDNQTRMRPVALDLNRHQIAELERYMEQSPKWNKCLHGYTTGAIVYSYKCMNGSVPRIGRDY